jgi:2-hydroxychromene-2-carboxylate isomerase
MTEQFKEQGGSATMDPSPMMRWVTSRAIRSVINPRRLEQSRVKAERERLKQGNGHSVEYFHQVDDGYSHLAVQALTGLSDCYDIELTVHLVRGPSGNNLPEPELLPRLSLWDAALVSSHYGLNFPQGASLPNSATVAQANAILAGVAVAEFQAAAVAVGEAVFGADSESALTELQKKHAAVSAAETRDILDRGDARQAELKHYSGAMFYYAGEWYWGVDRLYHLEKRLQALGASRRAAEQPLYPRPAIETGPRKDDGRLTLEVYASLRSPYTALIFDKAVQLAADAGVTLSLCPVLPMVMRGVSLSRQKGLYIFADAKREATALGVEFGKFSDPIGSPVRRCYSLFDWARGQGKHVELMSSFLKAAFVEGVNTNVDKGLKVVVEKAGLSWEDARKIIDNNDWQAELEKNRTTMYGFDCWGVPSFRLRDASGKTLVAAWGQDRLWLISRKIQEAIASYSS